MTVYENIPAHSLFKPLNINTLLITATIRKGIEFAIFYTFFVKKILDK